MSSKAKKLQNEALAFKEQPAPKTRSVTVRLDLTFELDGQNDKEMGECSTFMRLDGIPMDLPPSMEEPIIKGAEHQFVAALNQRMFLEVYPRDADPRETHPQFINLTRVDYICVIGVAKVVEDKEKKED
mgnify:CR=1 FL=1